MVRFAVVESVIHVLAVGSGVREALETLFALEWFFAAVQALVFGQVVFVLEGLAAQFALVRSLTWKDKGHN